MRNRVIKLLMAQMLFLVVIISPILTSYASAPKVLASNETTKISAVTRTDAETYYIKAINDLRKSHNLKPLIIDNRLVESANKKGEDMALHNYWGHYSNYGGPSFSEYIWANSPDADTVGENLARCFETRQAAFAALVASPTHLAIMVGDFNDFGVAEVADPASGCINTVMHFAKYN